MESCWPWKAWGLWGGGTLLWACPERWAAAHSPGIASGVSGQLVSFSGADAGAWPLGSVGPTTKKCRTEPPSPCLQPPPELFLPGKLDETDLLLEAGLAQLRWLRETDKEGGKFFREWTQASHLFFTGHSSGRDGGDSSGGTSTEWGAQRWTHSSPLCRTGPRPPERAGLPGEGRAERIPLQPRFG